MRWKKRKGIVRGWEKMKLNCKEARVRHAGKEGSPTVTSQADSLVQSACTDGRYFWFESVPDTAIQTAIAFFARKNYLLRDIHGEAKMAD